jgi:hypothetical protein
MDIFTPEQFRAAVHVIVQQKQDWKPADFMNIVQYHILASARKKDVHNDVFILYFTLYTNLTGKVVTRMKILNTLYQIQWL